MEDILQPRIQFQTFFPTHKKRKTRIEEKGWQETIQPKFCPTILSGNGVSRNYQSLKFQKLLSELKDKKNINEYVIQLCLKFRFFVVEKQTKKGEDETIPFNPEYNSTFLARFLGDTVVWNILTLVKGLNGSTKGQGQPNYIKLKKMEKYFEI